jgi:hypothetical protein
MKFKKICRSLLNEMPGQLSQLDYKQNPDAPIAASGVVQDRWHPMHDKDIKKASGTKAVGTDNGEWESNAVDTYRAKAGVLLGTLIKDKKNYKSPQDLANVIKPLTGMVSNLSRYTKDSNDKPVPEDKRKLIVLETGKEYSLLKAAKFIIDTIVSYEKKFNLILWEGNDPQWKELAKSGVTKKQVGFWSVTLDRLSPLAKIARYQTTRQRKGKRYLLALDKDSDTKNNVWVVWRKLDKKGAPPQSIGEFIKYLRTRHGGLSDRSAASEKGLGTTLQRESEKGNLPLKFIGVDKKGYPQFGDQLTFAEVRNTTIEELLELTGHYELIKVIEGWEDNNPKYAKYDIQRFVAKGATQEPRGRTVRIKKTQKPSFITN